MAVVPWTVRSRWEPLSDGHVSDITLGYADREEARRQGLSLTCCTGAELIEVRSPDGNLTFCWDRASNIWLECPTANPGPPDTPRN